MELSSFSENIVTETFERSGETIELKINIDAIVPDYFERLAELLAPLNERLEVLSSKYKALQSEVKKQNKTKKPGKAHSLLPLQKELGELERESYAIKLTCPVRLPDGSFTQFLKDWNTTENGVLIPPTRENLIRLPPSAVKELWERCIARTTTVKKRAEDTTATSESAPAGSAGLRVVGQNT